MPEWRKLHTRITRSMDVNDLPDDFCRLLWSWLPLACDSAGRCLDHPGLIRSRVFPLREDVTAKQVAEALAAIADHGLIARYSVGAHQYFYIPNWVKYQGSPTTRKEGLPEYPDPDAPVETEQKDNSESTPLLVVDSLDDKSALDKTRREETRLESAPSGASISGPIPQREMFGALAQVCQSDQNLERGKLGTLSNADRAELEAYFCELTYLDPPKYGTEKERKAAGVRWVTPLREIYEKADGDMGHAKALIQEALADLDGMTIEAPASILKTVKGIVAKEKRGDASGRLQPKPPATTPAIYQNPDGTWFMPVGGHDARR